MDPEGARLLTVLYAYGKPCLCKHKYSSLRSTAHRAAAGAAPLQQASALHAALHALRRQYTGEGSMSSFKSIT